MIDPARECLRLRRGIEDVLRELRSDALASDDGETRAALSRVDDALSLVLNGSKARPSMRLRLPIRARGVR